ncbi:MAG: hypothetical protein WCJ26_02245 [bacterium]
MDTGGSEGANKSLSNDKVDKALTEFQNFRDNQMVKDSGLGAEIDKILPPGVNGFSGGGSMESSSMNSAGAGNTGMGSPAVIGNDSPGGAPAGVSGSSPGTAPGNESSGGSAKNEDFKIDTSF